MVMEPVLGDLTTLVSSFRSREHYTAYVFAAFLSDSVTPSSRVAATFSLTSQPSAELHASPAYYVDSYFPAILLVVTAFLEALAYSWRLLHLHFELSSVTKRR